MEESQDNEEDLDFFDITQFGQKISEKKLEQENLNHISRNEKPQSQKKQVAFKSDQQQSNQQQQTETFRQERNEQLNGNNKKSQQSSKKEDLNKQSYKKSQKVIKLEQEYKEHLEKQSALKEFKSKEYQFRTVIDHLQSLNTNKSKQLEALNAQATAVSKTNNTSASISKTNQDLAQMKLVQLKEKITKQEQRLSEEEFYTKTLVHMESRLIEQKEIASKMQVEYQQLHNALVNSVDELCNEEKQITGQKTLNVCRTQFVKKGMDHIENIHQLVMKKTTKLHQQADSELKKEISMYKDIKENLETARAQLKQTEMEIHNLDMLHQEKIKQQQDLDSLIDYLPDFTLLAMVYVNNSPNIHFTSQLSFKPQIDFSMVTEEYNEEVEIRKRKKTVGSEGSRDKDEHNNSRIENDGIIVINAAQRKFTEMILKQKNIILYAMKRKKKLTEIKNEIEDEEAKAHFIVNSLNQFYESHNNDIPGLFDSLSESFQAACRQRDNLSSKIVQLEFDKKKVQEEMQELERQIAFQKDSNKPKKKDLQIMPDVEDINISFNQIFSEHFVNTDFIREYLEDCHREEKEPIDIYSLLEKHENKQTSSLLHEESEELNRNFNTFLYSSNFMLMKFFSLLKQIKDRGDGSNSELNDMIEETLEFLKNWKVQSKELDSVNRKRLAVEMKDANIAYITKNIMAQKVLLDCLTVESSGDCLFGIMKVYDRVFNEKHTLKQMCERIISAEEQKYTTQRRKTKYSSQSGSSNSSSKNSDDNKDNDDDHDETIRDRIEGVYYQISNWNPKRAKEWLAEMLESNCLIWKYTSKVHIVEYMSRVKQKYDTALEEYLKSSEEFVQGNQQVTIDENFLINLQIEEWKELFSKANKTAKEWIQVVMQLFKKSLTVLLKRKKLLNLQLGTIAKYDPVRTYQLEKFDGKLTGLLTALQSQKSYQISLYQGREHESTADTLQCVSKDTEIPPRTNKKLNIFHIIKEHIMTMQQGEDFINIREDLNGFEADRDKLKLQILKKPKQKDRNSSGNRFTTGNRSQDPEEENENEYVESQKMKQDDIQNEEDDNMNAFRSEEGKQTKEEEEEISKKKMMLLIGMIGDHSKGNGNCSSVAQQKILHELTQEIKTVQRNDLKEIVRLEKANIVHQQKQYKYARDSYIKDRNIEDMQSKLEKEINKQIHLIQSNNNVPFAQSAQINNQLLQIQTQVQQAGVPIKIGSSPQSKFFIRPNSSSPRYCNQAIKKKQQIEAEKILYQAQNQLQQLSLPAANHGNIMNANAEDQKNGGAGDKKTKKMRKLFLEIMKEKWQKKELSRIRHLEKGGNTFGNFSESKKQNDQDEETENNMPQFTSQVQKLIGSFGAIPMASPSRNKICFDDSSIKRISGLESQNNFLISNQLANAESLQNQFLNMSQKNIALEQFARSHPHIADANSPDKSVRLFQNSVKAIKILNRFVKETQEQDPQKNQFLFPQSRPQSSSPMSQGVAKRDFNIRSISPQHQKNNWMFSSDKNIKHDLLFDLKNNENKQNSQRIVHDNNQRTQRYDESYGNSSPLSANIKRRGGKEIFPSSYQQIQKEVVTKMATKKQIEKQKKSYLEQKLLSETSMNRKSSREEMMRPTKLKYSKLPSAGASKQTRQPGISLIGQRHRNQTGKDKNDQSSSSQSSSNSSSFHLPSDVERELKQDLNRYFHQKIFD